MIGSLLTILATALSLLVVDIIFSGVSLANFPAAMAAGLVIGLVNSGIKPVISLLSLPLNILSLGGFSLVINGLCFWLASLFVPGFRVSGIIAFIVAPIILSFVSTFINKYFAERFASAAAE
ncbi:MAG: phage holin family protein [Cyanobacteria bacterium J06621_12]